MLNEFVRKSFNKPAHSAPPFETIPFGLPGCRLAISLNPGNSSSYTSGKLLPYLHRTVRELREAVNTGSMVLHPEFSNTGKIHYHGYLQPLKCPFEYKCVLDALASYGTYCIKHLFDAEADENRKWDDYCLKQAHLWQPLMKNTPYSYPLKIECTGIL